MSDFNQAASESAITENIFFEVKIASFGKLTPEAKSNLARAVFDVIEQKSREHGFLVGGLELKTNESRLDPGEYLGLTMRTRNVLKEAGIDTVEKLCCHNVRELLEYASMGRRSVNEIRESLAKKGLRLKGELSNEVG